MKRELWLFFLFFWFPQLYAAGGFIRYRCADVPQLAECYSIAEDPGENLQAGRSQPPQLLPTIGYTPAQAQDQWAESSDESDLDLDSFVPLIESEAASYGLQFNKIIDRLVQQKSSIEQMPDLVKADWEKVHTIGSSFVDKAIMYGRIIIQEYTLPDEQKTIKPLQVGGLAGGEKYAVQGIFFKFTKDVDTGGFWIYGGLQRNDYLASKSAGQELLSANRIFSCTSKLRIPLMAVIDYCGRRLMATALLPLNEWEFVYGSRDAGTTVLAADQTVNGIMQEVGKKCNLMPHVVNGRMMALCGDIEVHKADLKEKSAAYYCLDVARAFPPEAPPTSNPSISYRKLRPEYVGMYEKPLSSDGFSLFQSEAMHARECNRDIKVATTKLLNEHMEAYIKLIIQDEFITELLGNTSLYFAVRWSHRDTVDNFMINHMHKHGLNVRHLGKIAQMLSRQPSENVMLTRLRNYISTLMMSRSLKNYARRIMREEIKEQKELYARMITLMNQITGEKTAFFTRIIPGLVQEQFGYRLQDAYSECNQGFLLLDFTQLLGIILHPQCWQQFMADYGSEMRFMFAVSDIIEITPTIKYLNVIDLATGIHYLQIPGESSRIYNDFMLKAKSRLEKALARWADLSHLLIPEGLVEKLDAIKKVILTHKEEVKKSSQRTNIVKNMVNPLTVIATHYLQAEKAAPFEFITDTVGLSLAQWGKSGSSAKVVPEFMETDEKR